MSLFSILGFGDKAPVYPTDMVSTPSGQQVKFTFFGHASICMEFGELHIYVDPVSDYAKYISLPKADLVLVTHVHDDHLDRAAIDDVTTRRSILVCDKTAAEVFESECITMTPADKAQPLENVAIEAVAAYNVSEERTQFHPKELENCGYVLTLGGMRIYVAGDTEFTPEMAALRDIDVAFLPMQLPYTMTSEQVVEAVKTIRPKIFYPYHFGKERTTADVERELDALRDVTDVRVFPMG